MALLVTTAQAEPPLKCALDAAYAVTQYAYLNSVVTAIHAHIGLRVTPGDTLVRLEEQGLVASEDRPVEGSRGGRPRRVFRLTPEGWEALEAAQVAMSNMWKGVVRP